MQGCSLLAAQPFTPQMYKPASQIVLALIASMHANSEHACKCECESISVLYIILLIFARAMIETESPMREL